MTPLQCSKTHTVTFPKFTILTVWQIATMLMSSINFTKITILHKVCRKKIYTLKMTHCTAIQVKVRTEHKFPSKRVKAVQISVEKITMNFKKFPRTIRESSQ